MTDINIVFLDQATIPAGRKIPRPNFPHHWTDYDNTSPEQCYERCKEADIVVTNKVIFDRELLQRLPKLKLIALTATGMNNVDLEAAKELGIEVKNVAGYSNVSVPEHVIGMIFALKHSLIGYHRDQITSDRWATCGQFCYTDHPISDVRGSTLGVIGKGALGSEVARLAELLGMNVIFAERQGASEIRAGYLPFEQVLAQADIVTLHCPLTEQTKHIINQQTLSLMKNSAYLINTGRGPLIDEKALLTALENGQIAGAALDVLTKEPPELNDPLIQAAKRLPNLLITPHVAWASDSAVETLIGKVRDNIEEFIKNDSY